MYQCAGVVDDPLEQWSFENLAQSVYFANETNRERASGSYFGRLAECPNPYVKQAGPANIKIRVVPKPQKQLISVIATPDLGDLISETLTNTGSVMREFWEAAAQATDPEKEFNSAWTCVTDEFARASARHASTRQRFASHERWVANTSFVHCLLLRSEAGVLGFRLLLDHFPNDEMRPILETTEQVVRVLVLAANGIQVVGENAENWIRSGLTEARMLPKTRDALVGSAAIRSGVALPPLKLPPLLKLPARTRATKPESPVGS